MSDWISVKDDQKPSSRVCVLIAVSYVRYGEHEDGTQGEYQGREVAMGEYVPVFGDRLSFFDSFSAPHGDDWWITHWQPLPAPPTE